MSHPTIRFLDRAKETTSTSGSGSVSLGGAVAGFVAISGIGSGNSTYYTLQEGNNFEVGIGTYNSVGNVLSRDEVFLSSSSNNKIDLAGGATVFLTYPADKAVVKTSGNLVGIGTDPEYQLEVSGTGSFNTVRWADGTTQTTAATDTTYTAGTGLTLVGTQFDTTGTGYFDSLGIGTGSPDYLLHVAGDAGFDEYIYHNGDGNTFIRFAPDLINLVAGSWSAIKLEKSTGKIQLNNTNRDLDVQLMAEDGEVILHTDAATNQVGIGTAEPSYTLEVSGTGSFNTVRWADGTTQITSATGDISTVSGLTVTNANNIASTGATNAAAIAAKDNYQYWTATDGDATSNISTTEDVKITGAGQVTVSLASGNPSVFTVSGAAAGGGAPTDAQYVTLALDGDLSDERVLTASTGVHIVDGGANGNVAVSVSGSTTSQLGIVQLQDSATDGTTDRAITPNAVYDISGVLSTSIASTGSTNAASIATNTSNISTNTTNIASTGASNLSLIRSYIDTSDNATFNNLTAQGNLTVSGTLTYLDSTTVTIADKQLELASNSGTPIGNDSAVNDGGIVVKSTDSDKKWTWLDATDAWTSTENIKLNSGKKIIFGDSTEQTTSPTGDIATVSGLTVTNASNIASTGATNAAAIATKAPNDAQYVTLATDGDLSAERVLTPSTGVHIVDGGANGNVTVSVSGSTTSQLGIVQLQDSATDGTTDKAITPNAVYDISGALSSDIASTGAANAASIATNTSNISTNASNIASTGATNAADIVTVSGLLYDSWTLQGDSATTTSVDTTETVRFTGAGNTSVALGGTDNRTVTISGSGSDTTYTAGTGLSLTGTEFNVSGIDGSMIVNGSVTNADLTNSSITVTAGTGLAGGGAVSLGGTVSLDTSETGYFEKLGINDTSPDAMVDVVSDSTTTIGLILEMAAGGDTSVNPFEIRDNGSNVKASFDGEGDLSCGAVSGSGANWVLGRTAISPTIKVATGGNNLNIRNVNTDKDLNFDVASGQGAINIRDYPNLDNQFHFKMGRDSDGTGMYIRSRDDTSILTQWQSSGGTPVAMVNPTGAISGKHIIFPDGTTQATAATAGGGAPTDAQYVTLALDGDLSAERVLAASTGIHIVDGGANGNVTVSVSGSTTSQLGIVQLQDSATDGTTDKAITPNAVYDISGVLSTSIASTGATNAANIAATGATNAAAIAAKDNYQYWTALDNTSHTANIATTEDVKFSGVGSVTVTLASGDPTIVTVSGTAGGGGGGSPGGSDTQVQFNDSSSFGGDSDLTWNKTTNVLTVAGHIAATTKSFLIDHPVKEDKKLQYASLEGPENGVYVRGYTTSHVIELPDYWVALVDSESITVHLTPKGKPQPSLYVNRVSANKVYLSSDQHISAYYTVSATRKDVPPLEVEI